MYIYIYIYMCVCVCVCVCVRARARADTYVGVCVPVDNADKIIIFTDLMPHSVVL